MSSLHNHRAVIIAGRIALWGAVVLVFGRGIVSLFGGTSAATPDHPAKAGIQAEAFPASEATALALRFAADYLTYDADRPAEWATRIAAYGNDTLARGWNGAGRQTITTVVPARVDASGPDAGTVTVAARTPSGWVHLAVPIIKADGGLAVAAAPAFVAGPAAGSAPGVERGDADLAAGEALRPTLEAFFAAYGTGNSAVIGAMTADGTRLPRLEPGRFKLAAVEAVTVAREPVGPDRTAFAVVRWADETTGAALTQTYRLDVVQAGQRWLVAALGAATPIPEQSVNSKKEK